MMPDLLPDLLPQASFTISTHQHNCGVPWHGLQYRVAAQLPCPQTRSSACLTLSSFCISLAWDQGSQRIEEAHSE